MGVVDSCRECKAWEKPGDAVMPSMSHPGKFSEEIECNLMSCKWRIGSSSTDAFAGLFAKRLPTGRCVLCRALIAIAECSAAQLL
eukprot:5150050-Pyramimonas_sp.AAC.1